MAFKNKTVSLSCKLKLLDCPIIPLEGSVTVSINCVTLPKLLLAKLYFSIPALNAIIGRTPRNLSNV